MSVLLKQWRAGHQLHGLHTMHKNRGLDFHPSISALLPLLPVQAHSVATVKHAMQKVKDSSWDQTKLLLSLLTNLCLLLQNKFSGSGLKHMEKISTLWFQKVFIWKWLHSRPLGIGWKKVGGQQFWQRLGLHLQVQQSRFSLHKVLQKQGLPIRWQLARFISCFNVNTMGPK